MTHDSERIKESYEDLIPEISRMSTKSIKRLTELLDGKNEHIKALEKECAELRAEVASLSEGLGKVRKLVDAQAEDEGLWFMAKYATEAYLQSELRKLHDAVETFLTTEKGV